MFTIDQIKTAHAKVKTGAHFPAYVQELIRLGVRRYDTYVFDGHTNFFGTDEYQISSLAKYDLLNVEETTDKEQFALDLQAHQQGKTDFSTFCDDCARSGVEKWTVDMEAMTCTYLDRSGNLILVENIRVPEKNEI